MAPEPATPTNTVTLGNFDFGVGGSARGAAVSSGGGSGDLFTMVVLEDSSPFNDVYQSFTVGSLIKFDITLTTTVEGGPPDKFSFAILDSSLTNILTTDPGSQFITIEIDSLTSPTVQTFGSSPALFTVLPPSVTPVPEPNHVMLLVAGLVTVGVRETEELAEYARPPTSSSTCPGKKMTVQPVFQSGTVAEKHILDLRLDGDGWLPGERD